MEAFPGRQIPEDEIDLGNWGRRFSAILSYPFILFAKNKITTLLFIVAAIVCAVGFKYISTPTYKSSFIIRPNDTKEKFHLRILGDIQTLIKYHDNESLANALQVDKDLVPKIAGLQTAHPILKNSPDSVNFTEITITTTDYNTFIPIQTALLKYLETHPYFAKIRRIQEEQIRVHLELVNSDLLKLDSLKKIQLSSYQSGQLRQASSTLLITEVMNPTAVYTMAIERTNKKTALIAQQQFLDNFQLIKSCVITRQHTFPPRILLMCLYLIPIFLLVCFIFLAIKEKRR